MNRLVIYTAVTGRYDDLSKIISEQGVDYICFTDYSFSGVIPSPWKQIMLPDSKLNNKNLARYCKLNPHLLLPQYEHSLWIDGNIVIKNQIKDYVLDVLSKCDVASYDHWWRDKTEQEFYECARQGFDPVWKLKKQLSTYQNDGYVSNGFFENNVLLRNHNKPRLVAMQNEWWGEYLKGGKRDQYSFTYAAFKNHVKIHSLGVHDPRIKKVYFDYKEHRRRRPINQYILLFINRCFMAITRWQVSKPTQENHLLSCKHNLNKS